MKRRDFIKTGLKAGVALNALPLLVGNSPVRALGRSPLRGALETLSTNNGRVLVIVQLAGGNDGLNTLIPVGGSALTQYEALRSATGLRLTSNLKLADHDTLAWHSSMTGLDQLYKDHKVAIVQNVGYKDPTLSHFRGTDIWNTSTDSNIYASTGWIGRYLSVLNPSFPPPVIDPKDWPLAIQFGGLLSNVFLAQNGGMGIA